MLNLAYSLLLSLVITLSAQAAVNPVVEIKTNQGNIIAELYPAKAPQTVENFLTYVKKGFYSDTVFHRIVKNFVIQGGGFTKDFIPKETMSPIVNEADNGLTNKEGTLAMARGYEPDSATSQFFINLSDNKHLNHYKKHPDYYGYAVFGKVIQGMDTVEKIAALPISETGPFEEAPQQPVIIESIQVIDYLPTQSAVKGKAKAKKSRQTSKKGNTHG